MKKNKTNSKKNKYNILYITILSGLVIGFTFSGNIFKLELNSKLSNTPNCASNQRNPIIIHTDTDFTAANGVISGIGVESSPYIISNWIITPNVGQSGIVISGTSAFFIIRDCYIISENDGFGILLQNLQNGVALNNSVSNSSVGILCEEVSNVNITNNHIFNSIHEGITVRNSSKMILNDNNSHENTQFGILLDSSNNTIVENNDLSNNYWDGIRLESCFNDLIQNNTCTYCDDFGIILYFSEENTIIQNNCSFNGQWGLAFVFESQKNHAYLNFFRENEGGDIGDEFGANDCHDNIFYKGINNSSTSSANSTDDSNTTDEDTQTNPFDEFINEIDGYPIISFIVFIILPSIALIFHKKRKIIAN